MARKKQAAAKPKTGKKTAKSGAHAAPQPGQAAGSLPPHFGQNAKSAWTVNPHAGQSMETLA